MSEDEEKSQEASSSAWRWAELLFGGGVILYAAGATVSGIWWAATISGDIKEMKDRYAGIERRYDSLDNVALGNRMTKVEVEFQTFREQQREQSTRMERKIDRLLERRYGSPSGPGQAGGNQE